MPPKALTMRLNAYRRRHGTREEMSHPTSGRGRPQRIHQSSRAAAPPSGSRPPPEAAPTPPNVIKILLDQELMHLYDKRATE